MENLLNLALAATIQERDRSASLSTGYDGETRRWELIVRHSLPLPDLSELGIEEEELIGQYGILRVPEPLIGLVSELPQVEYIEKPKRRSLPSIRRRQPPVLPGCRFPEAGIIQI